MQNSFAQRGLTQVASLASLVLIWAGLAYALADPMTLPTPWSVAQAAAHEWQAGRLPKDLAATTIRVVLAFIFAMSLGGLLGYAMGRFERLNGWLDSWLILFLNLPALVIIVLCYLWVGLNEMAAILAVTLNKTPLVASIIREGARAQNTELRDLARAYKLPRLTQLRHIILPELAPHIASAARAGLSVIWKVVLVVEFLGRSSGIGFRIHLHFQQFDVRMVLAYALSFMLCILALEFAVIQPIERYINRWRSL
jgi:NitT/TauT family transport system permease protein